MEKMRYVYVIRCNVRFEDYSSEDFEYVWRVYSSLRKAFDCLELYKEIHTAELLNAGYDVVGDINHWVDLCKDGHYSHLTVKKGCNIKTYQISREILF
jgi:hypothetical protein